MDQNKKETYHFKCNYCKWDSFNCDQNKIVGDTPESIFRAVILMDQENENFKKRVEIFESKVSKLKKEEEQKNLPKFHTHLFGKKSVQKELIQNKPISNEKYTMTQMQEKLDNSEKNLNPRPSNTKHKENIEEDIEKFQSLNKVLEIKNESLDYCLKKITQIEKPKISRPKRQRLFCKCSVRCLECEKLLVRPEAGDSISFQRLHLAIKYLPNFHNILLKNHPFNPKEENSITFFLFNPLSCQVNVNILQLSPPESFSFSDPSQSNQELVLNPNSLLPQKSSPQLYPFTILYNPTSPSSTISFQIQIEYTGSVEKHQKTALNLTIDLI